MDEREGALPGEKGGFLLGEKKGPVVEQAGELVEGRNEGRRWMES